MRDSLGVLCCMMLVACGPSFDDALADQKTLDGDEQASASDLDAQKPSAPLVGTFHAYFSHPNGVDPDYALVNRLAQYINAAEPQSVIRGNITTLSLEVITRAVLAAKERGVTVYLVQNGVQTTEGAKLAAALGDHYVLCGVPNRFTSCVSEINGATHHVKDWTFSKLKLNGVTVRHVTWISSQNLTKTTSMMSNDAIAVHDNVELYEAHVRAYAWWFAQTRSKDFYNVPGRGHHLITSARAELSFAPQTTSPGHTTYDKSNDHVALALSRVGYAKGCSLKVAMLSVYASRSFVLDELIRLRRAGCRVQLAFTTIDQGALNRLRGVIELRRAATPAIHSKMAVFQGGSSKVWAGSHNWSTPSLRGRDEVFFEIENAALAADYARAFDTIWSRATAPVVAESIEEDQADLE